MLLVEHTICQALMAVGMLVWCKAKYNKRFEIDWNQSGEHIP
jgi:hypothetical protein